MAYPQYRSSVVDRQGGLPFGTPANQLIEDTMNLYVNSTTFEHTLKGVFLSQSVFPDPQDTYELDDGLGRTLKTRTYPEISSLVCPEVFDRGSQACAPPLY